MGLAHNVYRHVYGMPFGTFQNVSLLNAFYCQALYQFHEQRWTRPSHLGPQGTHRTEEGVGQLEC